MILKFLLSIVSGLVCHLLYRPSLLISPGSPRWGNLFRYAVGVFGTLPSFLLMLMDFWRDGLTLWEYMRAGLVSFMLAFLGFGTGTFVGHFIDYWRERQ